MYTSKALAAELFLELIIPFLLLILLAEIPFPAMLRQLRLILSQTNLLIFNDARVFERHCEVRISKAIEIL